jgi:hypothetical protein
VLRLHDHAGMANDERPQGMINGWAVAAAVVLAAALLLWTALFAAYRFDRPDAISVATMTVLLVIPPLASYYLAMEATRDRLSLSLQIAGTFGLAALWLIVQRLFVYPLVGFSVSIGESVSNFILLPSFGIAAWLGVQSFLYRKRLQTALALQAEMELRLLNAQLAPHALFNMLNTVYSVLLTDRDRAIPLFLSLSDALRHIIDRTRKPWIPLDEELAFIENYAALERARNPERVTIDIRVEGDRDVPVPPMLLATLFENAVTHGRFPDGTLHIEVNARIEDAEMQFSVANAYPSGRSASGMGVGLANVRKRLELLYSGRCRFDAGGTRGEFRARITISP